MYFKPSILQYYGLLRSPYSETSYYNPFLNSEISFCVPLTHPLEAVYYETSKTIYSFIPLYTSFI